MTVARQLFDQTHKETTMGDDTSKALGQVVQIDEGRIREHLGELVRGSVEDTLNALLDADAIALGLL